MTGYGYREVSDSTVSFSVEIKSYNNRYLDIIVNLPPFLSPLEPRIRELLGKRVNRGRVETTVRLRELTEDTRIYLDRNAVQGYIHVLHELIGEAGLKDDIRLSHLLRLDGVLRTEKSRNIDELWEKILPQFEEAYKDFEEARNSEGTFTKQDILEKIAIVEDVVRQIKTHGEALEERITEGIRERFHQVLGNKIDEDRVLAETAVLLVKYSINEELSRLSGHLSVFREIAEKPGLVGKKLDFLCQELNREINTIGSKSMIMEINQRVVDAKDALENIREQLRNVE